ncbi:APC family permease [Candidatus Bathyarchaeota archaeon]|nr:MAG: APC family permease [Candidatus Bathyarchaeota archaeon]TMI43997.1 MAG: APC family permease [Candidatus Bathyarchaeota archaeon]
MAEEKLFVRKATGLVREIGAITAIIIVMANTIGLGWQKRVFQYTGRAPLPENQYLAGIPPMTMAFILGGIAILLSVLAVSVLSSAMPRSGGGYVVISRIIGPVWGFLGAWLEFLSIAWSFGIIAVAVFEGIFQIMGPIAFGPFPLGANAFGSNITDVTLFAGGLVLVLVFTVIGIFGVRLTGLLLQAMFWVPSILTFYVFGLLSQANPTTVAQGMTNVLGHTPVDYVNGALSQGLDAAGSSAGGYWGAVFTAMVGAYFAYIGYAASTFVAGEIKEANKSLPRTLVIASVLIIALYVSISIIAADSIKGLASQTVGGNSYSLLSAWSFLSYGSGGDLVKAGLPNVKLWTTTVAGLTGSGINLGSVNFLLVVFGVFWIANDIPPFILTASRVLFAMSFDRVLPAPLANINDRFHSPVNAVIVTGIVGILGCFSESGVVDAGTGSWNLGGNVLLGQILSSSGGVAITDFYDSLFFTLFTLSLVILPLRASRRQIFETAPYKPGGKWGMVVLGILGFVANLTVDYIFVFAKYGDFELSQASPDTYAIVFTIIVAAIGVVVFYAHRMRRGINYSTIFAQIPPE